jgi:hypothetical protein
VTAIGFEPGTHEVGAGVCGPNWVHR